MRFASSSSFSNLSSKYFFGTVGAKTALIRRCSALRLKENAFLDVLKLFKALFIQRLHTPHHIKVNPTKADKTPKTPTTNKALSCEFNGTHGSLSNLNLTNHASFLPDNSSLLTLVISLSFAAICKLVIRSAPYFPLI